MMDLLKVGAAVLFSIAVALFLFHTEAMAYSKYPTRKRQQNWLGNKPTTCQQGHRHRSMLEASVCATLQLRKRAGEIAVIQTEVKIYLTLAKIGYMADFQCTTPNGLVFFVEAKGTPNDTWPIKKKLWKFYGPGPLEIWRGHHAKPTCEEVLIPEIYTNLV